MRSETSVTARARLSSSAAKTFQDEGEDEAAGERCPNRQLGPI
jgi:hypothetical protein